MTARGNPSGIATTNIVIAMTIYSTKSPIISRALLFCHPLVISHLIINTANMSNDDMMPNIPIFLAIFSNFNYKGVNSFSPEDIIAFILPIALFLPTLIATISAFPLNTFVPANKTGEGTS